MRQKKTKPKSQRAIRADARRAARSRAVLGGGRPKKMKTCDHCEHEFGTVEMREHADELRRRGISINRDGKFVKAAAQ